MEKDNILNTRDCLVIDHEDIGDFKIPGQKRKVSTLKNARTLLLEEDFKSIVFLSLLEEANEVEIFVKGVRSHPKLSSMPIFCEYGLYLALPKDLGLLGFEENELNSEENEEELDENFEIDQDIDKNLLLQNLSSGSVKIDKLDKIEDLKKISAKALVLLELNSNLEMSKKDLISEYMSLLKRELDDYLSS
jgi:hypothetical protein